MGFDLKSAQAALPVHVASPFLLDSAYNTYEEKTRNKSDNPLVGNRNGGCNLEVKF